VTPTALLPGLNRAPGWPSEVVGSITHCDGFCGAVVARHGRILGVGLDAEPAEPLPPEVISRICTPTEIHWIRRAQPAPAGDWYRLVFSAKESVYKACHPVVQRVLGFSEVELLPSGGGALQVRAASARLADEIADAELHARFLFTDAHMITGAALLDGGSS
jgi:4'-phosphopantetheinyl transferase EntD